MASIEKRVRDGPTSWRAHYRTPAGAQRNKTFARKIDIAWPPPTKRRRHR